VREPERERIIHTKMEGEGGAEGGGGGGAKAPTVLPTNSHFSATPAWQLMVVGALWWLASTVRMWLLAVRHCSWDSAHPADWPPCREAVKQHPRYEPSQATVLTGSLSRTYTMAKSVASPVASGRHHVTSGSCSNGGLSGSPLSLAVALDHVRSIRARQSFPRHEKGSVHKAMRCLSRVDGVGLSGMKTRNNERYVETNAEWCLGIRVSGTWTFVSKSPQLPRAIRPEYYDEHYDEA
jgi:hypothetical protein